MTLDERMKSLYKDIHKQFEEYQKAVDELTSENELLRSIVKELKEYINAIGFKYGYTPLMIGIINNLYKILDKAGDIK